MQGSNTPALATSDEPSTQTICTLEPLRTEGRDSLTPDGTDDVLGAKLSQLDVTWENASHETTTEIADDLLRCPGPADKAQIPIPKGAEPIHAVFNFWLKGLPEPHAVELAPPDKVRYQHPDDAPRITPFLTKRHFLTLQKAAHLLAILLALASAAVPDSDDDDDDDGYDETHRYHFSA